MKEKRLLQGICLYALSMLVLFTLCVLCVVKSTPNASTQPSEPTQPAETVYVYVEITSDSKETTELPPQSYYKICAYEERIGVFAEDGTLLEVWDTYIKTLPKADQRLLEEGFILFTDEELNAAREDYTS